MFESGGGAPGGRPEYAAGSFMWSPSLTSPSYNSNHSDAFMRRCGIGNIRPNLKEGGAPAAPAGQKLRLADDSLVDDVISGSAPVHPLEPPSGEMTRPGARSGAGR